MLPLFNLRLFRNNNLTILQPFIDKMKRGELTLENILDEDEIIQDLKNNKNSQFSSFFSNENIRKLIDYATKMPILLMLLSYYAVIILVLWKDL